MELRSTARSRPWPLHWPIAVLVLVASGHLGRGAEQADTHRATRLEQGPAHPPPRTSETVPEPDRRPSVSGMEAPAGSLVHQLEEASRLLDPKDPLLPPVPDEHELFCRALDALDAVIVHRRLLLGFGSLGLVGGMAGALIALRRANHTLESRVAERTRELERDHTALLVEMAEHRRLEEERQQFEIQLRQAQKLEAIGQLAAGIAHEINTPTQFIGDNARFIQEAFRDLQPLFQIQPRLLDASRVGSVPPLLVEELRAAVQAADLPYLTEEIPKALRQSLDGVERVSGIVHAMKEFSHPGTSERCRFDLNQAIDSTITVCRNEWKHVADVVTDFAPDLPAVTAFPSELNQVFLNLLINATHAIAEANHGRSSTKGVITITTRRDLGEVEVRVADSGTGISEVHRSRIFEPFFTTKGVGKGTGQGLALSHAVVVKKHGGSIRFETEVGRGTTFILRLPIHPGPETCHHLVE